MKRGRIRIVVISILILIVVIGLVIRQLPGNRMKRLIKQGNDLLLEQEYEKAADVFTPMPVWERRRKRGLIISERKN